MENDLPPLEQMRRWVARLNEAAAAYYGGRGELMSDFEWDALFDRLKELEAATGVVLPDSPTNSVFGDVDAAAGQKEPHEFAALSLAKTKSVDAVATWAEGRPVWISWKLDGLTLVATYDGGKLSKLLTRGDGHVGTNITRLARGILGIPPTVKESGHLVVRGEAVISYADFEAFVAGSSEDYANPRNLASGSLSLKDVGELRQRRLQWIPFTLVHADRDIASWGERLDYLRDIGLNPIERERVDSPDAATLRKAIDRWTEKVAGKTNPFPVDGLVITYDDTAYARTGSVTGRHATRAGLAFKWQDETAATVLEHIEWSCAVASISPIAVFRPVQLEGTTVQRASLVNISECERLGVGGPGTELSVIKSNKIIPKVVEVTKTVGTLDIPEACPVCEAPTAVNEAESGTKTLRCTNPHCPARELRKFIRFASKDGMDIDGLGGETLAKFVNKGWIRTFADIYRLGARREEIAAMEGFGAKSALNLAEAIEEARARPAPRFLVALSIPLCGIDVAQRLLGAYGDVETLFAKAADAVRSADLFDSGEEVFADIDGIGPGKSAAFVRWCADPANLAQVEDLLGEVTLEPYTPATTGGACGGLTFVITGDVRHWANRAGLQAYIEQAGGKVAGSVSKSTDFLINNDLASTSGKNKKARELGIPVLSEEDFLARFGG
ncbi:MAG: NAD-dependent DNA ligase LigA [Kiritimatiellia bacterium]|jgi:DNA ligase (NAD+)